MIRGACAVGGSRRKPEWESRNSTDSKGTARIRSHADTVEPTPSSKQQRKRAIRYPKGMPFKVVDLAFINGDWQNIAL